MLGAEQRSEPAEMFGTAMLFVNAANPPLAAEHAVVHVVFVKAELSPVGRILRVISQGFGGSFDISSGVSTT